MFYFFELDKDFIPQFDVNSSGTRVLSFRPLIEQAKMIYQNEQTMAGQKLPPGNGR